MITKTNHKKDAFKIIFTKNKMKILKNNIEFADKWCFAVIKFFLNKKNAKTGTNLIAAMNKGILLFSSL